VVYLAGGTLKRWQGTLMQQQMGRNTVTTVRPSWHGRFRLVRCTGLAVRHQAAADPDKRPRLFPELGPRVAFHRACLHPRTLDVVRCQTYHSGPPPCHTSHRRYIHRHVTHVHALRPIKRALSVSGL
jgi:hypothetical protein